MGLIEKIKALFDNKPEVPAGEYRPPDFRTGARQEDIAGYLKEYSASGYPVDAVKPVFCPACNCNVCQVSLDADEGAVKLHCDQCKQPRFLLDSEEYWEECSPLEPACPCCGGKRYQLAVGIAYRDAESVKWVSIGCRCVTCNVLGCFADWKVEFSREEETGFFSESENRAAQ